MATNKERARKILNFIKSKYLIGCIIVLLIAVAYLLGRSNSLFLGSSGSQKLTPTVKLVIPTPIPSPKPMVTPSPILTQPSAPVPSDRAYKAASQILAIFIAQGMSIEHIYDVWSPAKRTQEDAVNNLALKLDKNPILLAQTEDEIAKYNNASHPVIVMPLP